MADARAWTQPSISRAWVVILELIGIVGNPSQVLSVADISAKQYDANFSRGPSKNPEWVFPDVARYCSMAFVHLRVEQNSLFNAADLRPLRSVGFL